MNQWSKSRRKMKRFDYVARLRYKFEMKVMQRFAEELEKFILYGADVRSVKASPIPWLWRIPNDHTS